MLEGDAFMEGYIRLHVASPELLNGFLWFREPTLKVGADIDFCTYFYLPLLISSFFVNSFQFSLFIKPASISYSAG
jgi:hypothetical protein